MLLEFQIRHAPGKVLDCQHHFILIYLARIISVDRMESQKVLGDLLLVNIANEKDQDGGLEVWKSFYGLQSQKYFCNLLLLDLAFEWLKLCDPGMFQCLLACQAFVNVRLDQSLDEFFSVPWDTIPEIARKLVIRRQYLLIEFILVNWFKGLLAW